MQHTKRGRNQRRRPGGGSNPNRALDSNGPEVRIRGTANQIYDKYIALARDASSSGDRIKAESYLQHAEHYFRIIRATQQSQQNQQPQKQGESRGEQPNVGESAGGSEATCNVQQDETRESQHKDSESVESKTAAEPEQEHTDSVENSSAPALAEEEKKPRRRRTRRPTKRVESDSADKSGEETAATAAE